MFSPTSAWIRSTVNAVQLGLPEELTTLAAWVTRVADARPVGDYVRVLDDSGVCTVFAESHDAAVAWVIHRIESRIRLLRMTASVCLTETGRRRRGAALHGAGHGGGRWPAR